MDHPNENMEPFSEPQEVVLHYEAHVKIGRAHV